MNDCPQGFALIFGNERYGHRGIEERLPGIQIVRQGSNGERISAGSFLVHSRDQVEIGGVAYSYRDTFPLRADQYCCASFVSSLKATSLRIRKIQQHRIAGLNLVTRVTPTTLGQRSCQSRSGWFRGLRFYIASQDNLRINFDEKSFFSARQLL